MLMIVAVMSMMVGILKICGRVLSYLLCVWLIFLVFFERLEGFLDGFMKELRLVSFRRKFLFFC